MFCPCHTAVAHAKASVQGRRPQIQFIPSCWISRFILSSNHQVCKLPELKAWQLYLVDWGYNTLAERERAAANPRIQLLSLGDSFARATGTWK